MSLAEYLAKNYLTADQPAKKPSKRKRKRHATAEAGLQITDDDTAALPPSTTAADDAAVDDAGPVVMMASGAHAGLQTAAQVAAQVERARAAETRRLLAAGAGAGAGGAGETIYRDASGRVVNVAMQRAEARRKAEAEAQAQRDAEEEARGDVQRAAKAARRQELQDAALLSVARYADDEDLNEDLRAQARWNDPAAGFLKKRGGPGKSVTGRPLYRGAAPPNRYGIRPGHRWDGVDRGNGFEAEWFKARNRQKSRRDLEYAWQMDE